MKNKLIPFTLLSLSLLPQLAWSDACDRDTILRLMAEKKVIDVKDQSVCLDMSSFPSIRVKMQDQNYDLNGNRIEGKEDNQDAAVKRIVDALNAASGGKKSIIITKGVADGTFKGAPNPATEAGKRDLEIEKRLLPLISDENGISFKKLDAVIGKYDHPAAEAIKEEMIKWNRANKRGDTESVPFNKIEDETRLKSMVRNTMLAKSRAEFLCTKIFGSMDACTTQGEISPLLDQGKRNYDGCCDGRRGAVIDIIAPDAALSSSFGKGVYQPTFDKPSDNYQGKLQMAGSMSVFALPLKSDPELEKKILEENGFEISEDDGKPTAEALKLLERDRQRFKEAMAGTGCAENEFAVDAARRIYWNVKNQKDYVSPELYEAVMKNDFNKAYSILETTKNQTDRNLFSTLMSGANTVKARSQSNNCPKTQLLYLEPANFSRKELEACKISPSSDPEILKFGNMRELLRSDWVKPGRKSSNVVIVGDDDKTAKGNFYLYDKNTKKSYFFSFDQSCMALSGVKLRNKKETWHSEQVAARKDLFNVSCFMQITKDSLKPINELFHPQAPISKGMPSDALNCLDVSKGIDHEMAAGGMENERSGTPYCKVQAGGNLSLILDPNSIKSHSGHHGTICGACGNGTQLRPDIAYSPRQDSKNGGKQRELAGKTFTDAHSKVKDNPLTLSSLKHFRSYVIPNCGPSCADACACLREGNLKERLKASDVEVVDFSKITGAKKNQAIAYTERPESGSFACIFTPPVPHTCSVNPMGSGTRDDDREDYVEETCPLEESLKKMPTVAKVTDEDLDNYKKNCGKMNFPQSEKSCQETANGGPMCFAIKKKAGVIKGSPSKSSGSGATATKQ